MKWYLNSIVVYIISTLTIIIVSVSFVSAQRSNLVPNSSFEAYTRCYSSPTALPIDNTVGWSNLTLQASFLLHGCYINAQNSPVFYPNYPGPPGAWVGHTGIGCVFISAGINDKKEPSSSYASARLKEPLLTGKLYCISVYYRNYVEPAMSLGGENTYGFGICLTNQPLRTNPGEQDIRANPVAVIRNNVRGTIWNKFQSCYKATGDEQYITLGFFHDDILRMPVEYVTVSATQTTFIQQSRLVFDDVSVIAIEEAQLLGPDTSFCANATLKLRASFACANTYRWSDGSSDSTLSVTKAGRYWVAIQTDCGTLRDTITVTERKNDLNLGPDTTLCAGQTIRLQVPPTSSLIRWDDETNLPDRTVAKHGTYWAYTEQNGCQKRDEITLTAAYPPQLRLPTDTTRCEDSPGIWLRAGPPAYRYRWSDGSTDSVRTLTSAGIYSVAAQNECGKAEVQIRLGVSNCRCAVYWPTAFTPNGDGTNDVFAGYVNCRYRLIKAINWQVYNRWGEVVYQSTALTGGWDGYYQGVAAPAGMYSYKLVVTTDQEGQSKVTEFTGSVELLR
jgi:gliding motility-associated-like protein